VNIKISSKLRKKDYLLIITVLFSLSLLLSNVFKNETVWWDEADYLNFANYLATGHFDYNFATTDYTPGSSITIRAIFYPFCLGLISLIINNEVFLRIINLLFSFFTIIITYIIFKKMFNSKISFFTTMLFTSNWVFQFYSIRFLTEAPALLIQMISIYFFLKKGAKNKILSGVFLGLATITRFSSLLIAPTYLLMNLLYYKKKEDFYWIPSIFIGFIPSLIIDIFSGNAIFTSIINFLDYNVFSSTAKTSVYLGDWYYYIQYSSNCFTFPLNILLLIAIIFTILSIITINKKSKLIKNKSKIFVLSNFLICFFMFSFTPLKDFRYTIQAFPFIYVILVNFVYKIIKKTKNNTRLVLTIISLILLSYAIISSIVYLNSFIEIKKDLGISIKNAGKYIQSVTDNEDYIMANYPPVSTYYSNRRIIRFGNNGTEFKNLIDKYNINYILLNNLEPYPDFVTNITDYYNIQVREFTNNNQQSFLIQII
jgi:glycosyl transferase family 22 (putative mannosyltransferase)